MSYVPKSEPEVGSDPEVEVIDLEDVTDIVSCDIHT
jgi:hypothetical protein